MHTAEFMIETLGQLGPRGVSARTVNEPSRSFTVLKEGPEDHYGSQAVWLAKTFKAAHGL